MKGLSIAGIVVGSLLILGPVFGILGSMLNAFQTLGQNGVSDPRALAENVGTVMMSTMMGFLILPLGIAVLAVSLVFFFRKPAGAAPSLPQEG